MRAVSPADPPIPHTQFYLNSSDRVMKPKSQFERAYEEKIRKILVTDELSEFLALELESKLVSSLPPSLVGGFEETLNEVADVTEIDSHLEEQDTSGAMDISITPEFLSEQTKNPEFVCSWLLYSADHFLDQAHKSVLATNYLEGTSMYYRFVKAALKALHMVVSDYLTVLQPAQAAKVYYQMAKVYLEETEDCGRAEQYAKKAMALSAHNGLKSSRVAAELLYAEILDISDRELLEPFLTERQELHQQEGNIDVSCSLKLKRVATSLSAHNFSSRLKLLNFTEQTSVDPKLRSLGLLWKAKLLLAKGAAQDAAQALHQCRGVFLQMKDVTSQLKAMLYLQNLAVSIHINDSKHGQKWVQKLTDLIHREENDHWSSWNDDGSITISLALKSGSLLFLLHWISPDELVGLFHLMSGIFSLSESDHDRAKQSLKVSYQTAERHILALTSHQVTNRSFKISHLTKKIVRFSCIKFLAAFYQVWLSFMSESDFGGIKIIYAFIDSYNQENFTQEELWYYNFLIAPFLYLSALHAQSQGELNRAKYYFMKVRKLCSLDTNIPTGGVQLQNSLGFGGVLVSLACSQRELHIYSTLHLLNIAEYEFRSLSQRKNSSPQHEQAIQKARSSLASLHAEMASITETSLTGFSSTHLFSLTYKSALAAYHTNGIDDTEKNFDDDLKTELEKLVFENTNHQNVELLALYILLRMAVSLDQSKRLYGKCTRRISKADDNGRILSLFVYLEAQRRELGKHDPAKGQKIKRKIEAVRESIHHKFEKARSSVLQV